MLGISNYDIIQENKCNIPNNIHIIKQIDRFILTKTKYNYRISDITSDNIHVHFNKETAAKTFMNVVLRDKVKPYSNYFIKCTERLLSVDEISGLKKHKRYKKKIKYINNRNHISCKKRR